MTRPWDKLKRADFDIALRVAGPVLSKSSGMRRPGLDAAFARARDGRPLLPGTHVAGHLAEAWETLSDPELGLDLKPLGDKAIDACHWLGRASHPQQGRRIARSGESDDPANSNKPDRRRLVFDDFVLTGAATEENQRVRIALGESGAVKPHALQFIEDAVPTGRDSEAVFCGRAYALGDERELAALERGLRVGLRSVERVGADKGIGYGEVKSVRVASVEPPVTDFPHEALEPGATRFALIIRPRGAMLFSRPLAAGNVFESLDEIPGAAIKGALAELARIGDASVADWKGSRFFEHFSAIRFGHAFPAYAAYRRPVRPPLSLAKSRDEQLDTALIGELPLLDERALEFYPDWKPDFAAKVREKFGWAAPRRELRVRTAIDYELRRAAEAQLFAYETILPEDAAGQRIEWYGYIDFAAVTDAAERGEAVEQLRELLRRFGLCLLGKTKVSADAGLRRAEMVSPAVAQGREPVTYLDRTEPHWVLTLQTDAVLVGNQALRPDATAESLRAAYARIWRQISGERLELVDYFAQQKLVGGGYLHRRFLKHGASEYEPVPLTEAGSVFVLKQAKEGAAAMVRELAERGLPLPQWALERYGGTAGSDEANLWQHLPYLRHNGYGEVAVNLAVHTERAPWLTAALGNQRSGGAA